MKVSEIITESPKDIKLLLLAIGYDLYFIRNTSIKIQKQYLIYNSQQHKAKMHQLLAALNRKLLEISQIPQWEHWADVPDGKMVQREMDAIYNNNLEFIAKHK